MKITIALQLAWRSLRLNILRTSLTVLGVVIGVAAIIVVFAASDGINSLILGEIQSYGTDTIQTETKVPSKKNSLVVGEVTTLKISDLEAVNRLSNVRDSYAVSLGQQKVSWGGESKKVFLFGTSPAYAVIDSKTKLAVGEFFSIEEDRGQALVAVLGASLKNYLFGDQNAIGQSIKIGNSKFRVIGVLTEQGSGAGFLDFDNMVYLPINTLHKRLLGIDYAMYFMHRLVDVGRADETAAEIIELLRERHEITNPDKDDFRVTTMAEMITTLGTVTNALTGLLLAIVLISLIVGGVGIMNIMYVTVSERTPEIGLRKALGATRRDVTWQFLIESLLITVWGWFLGTILGILAASGLSLIANAFAINWNLVFPWPGVLVSFGFSVLCGLLFGFKPAQRAATLDPITALRAE